MLRVECLGAAVVSPSTPQGDHGGQRQRVLLQDDCFMGIQLESIRPGRPVENAFIESFDGRLRDGCLNSNPFVWPENARRKLEVCRIDYNTMRPHSRGGICPFSGWCNLGERHHMVVT